MQIKYFMRKRSHLAQFRRKGGMCLKYMLILLIVPLLFLLLFDNPMHYRHRVPSPWDKTQRIYDLEYKFQGASSTLCFLLFMAVVTSLGQRNKEDNISQEPKKHAKINKRKKILLTCIIYSYSITWHCFLETTMLDSFIIKKQCRIPIAYFSLAFFLSKKTFHLHLFHLILYLS